MCLDIDLSTVVPGLYFGTHRSPVKQINDAIETASKLEQSEMPELDGIKGYEAQIAGVTDQDSGQRLKSMMVRKLKSRSKKENSQKRVAVVQAIEHENGRKLRFVNGGGTGSLDSTGKELVVTEMTAVSGFYNPHLFDKYADFQLELATGFAMEIIRIPNEYIYTCSGDAYIVFGTAGKDRLLVIYLPKEASLIPKEGVGEVQTPIEYKGLMKMSRGDAIFMRHTKTGELC